MEIWILYYSLQGDATHNPRLVIGGEYQTEQQCLRGGINQLRAAHREFPHRKIKWFCEISKTNG